MADEFVDEMNRYSAESKIIHEGKSICEAFKCKWHHSADFYGCGRHSLESRYKVARFCELNEVKNTVTDNHYIYAENPDLISRIQLKVFDAVVSAIQSEKDD